MGPYSTLCPQPPRRDHTHIVETFMKDEVPLPNGFQALDDVGTPKPRMPAEGKTKTEARRVARPFCGSAVLTFSAAPQRAVTQRSPDPGIPCRGDGNSARAAVCHSPVASLQGSGLLFRHLSLAQHLQLRHVCPPLLSQASLPYSCQLLRVLDLEQGGTSQKGSHSLF